MGYKQLTKNKKDLNTLNFKQKNMKKGGSSKLKGIELIRAIKEAQKDPEFIKEINKFIKATTTIRKLY